MQSSPFAPIGWQAKKAIAVAAAALTWPAPVVANVCYSASVCIQELQQGFSVWGPHAVIPCGRYWVASQEGN